MYQAPEAESHFVPDLPDSCPRVHISLAVIDRLGFEAVEAFKSVPKRGLEIGGILLGYVVPGSINDLDPTILVEDFELIESEHQQGPSYLLSDRDKLDFEQAVSRHRRQPPGELRPVGFFRSHTRGDFDFDEHDISIAQGLFSREPSVCLLVKPTAVGLSLGRIGIWKQASLESFNTFPFKVAALREGDFRIVSGLPEAPAPSPEPVLQFADEIPSPAVATPVAGFHWEWVRDSAVLLGLAAALLLAAYLTRSPQRAVPPVKKIAQATTNEGSPVALSVEHRNGSTVLSWDRNSDAVQQAASGVLQIQDADKHQEIHLDRNELDAGRILYVPTSAKVNFLMHLVPTDHALVASVPADADGETSPAPVEADAEPSKPEPALVPRPRKQRQATNDADDAESHRPSPFAPPQNARLTNTPAVATPPPADPQPKLVAAIPTPAPEPIVAPPPVIAQDKVLTSVEVEPVGKSSFKKILTSPEHLFRAGDERAVPRAVREVQPKVPANLLADQRLAEVDVKVTIGWNGFVMKAQVKERGIDDRIAQAVVRAAREWTFEPVHDVNGPLDRQAVLRFHLKRSNDSNL